jgi:hypothetical protein
MKTMALIGLILVATVSTGIAADTLMTIQTNTTVRIDPITGQVKGDAQTQVRGIRKSQELPEAVNTSAPGTAVAANTGATTPVTATTVADPTTATAPVSVGASTDPKTVTAPVGAAPPNAPCPVCPSQPVATGLKN